MSLREENTEKNADTNDSSSDSRNMDLFIQLLTANQHRIYAYILSVMANSSDADDVMQETTSIMWRKFSEFTPGTSFVAWGMTVAYYAILAYRKRHKKTVLLGEEAIQLIESDFRRVYNEIDYRMDALKNCLEKLPENDRMLISMKYAGEMPVESIAERVARNTRSVYRSLSRIHELLFRCVQRSLGADA